MGLAWSKTGDEIGRVVKWDDNPSKRLLHLGFLQRRTFYFQCTKWEMTKTLLHQSSISDACDIASLREEELVGRALSHGQHIYTA
jgi:hypothetical protein